MHYNAESEIYTVGGYYYKICSCCGQVIRSKTDDFKGLV